MLFWHKSLNAAFMHSGVYALMQVYASMAYSRVKSSINMSSCLSRVQKHAHNLSWMPESVHEAFVFNHWYINPCLILFLFTVTMKYVDFHFSEQGLHCLGKHLLRILSWLAIGRLIIHSTFYPLCPS